MRIVFGSLKYLFKNIWYILPYAILPAVFFTLLLDYSAISDLVGAFFSGTPNSDFLLNFRAMSLLRIDLLGGIYTVCAFVCFVVFETLMLSVVEKHMRLGKRTMSGAFTQFGNLLLSVIGFTLVYFIRSVGGCAFGGVFRAVVHREHGSCLYSQRACFRGFFAGADLSYHHLLSLAAL